MDTPSAWKTAVAGSRDAQAPLSLFPRTAVTGAIAASATSTSGAQMSPAWMMCWAPCKAASASGRSRPWVSEMTPMSIVAARGR
jgi:hypothetical protein